jgi:D-glycero-D-manno-heptose 1,7-bisphosphate phosphatase
MEYRKPSPRFIRESIARHALNSADCWMVGDREADVETGRNAGIASVAVCTGKHDAAAWSRLAPAGVPVYPSIVEFVAALERTNGERHA